MADRPYFRDTFWVIFHLKEKQIHSEKRNAEWSMNVSGSDVGFSFPAESEDKRRMNIHLCFHPEAITLSMVPSEPIYTLI